MARRVLPLAAGAAVLLSLSGCGDYRQAQRPAWRTQAENACLADHLVQPSAYVQPAPPINGPGICGLTQPFHVTALLDGEVTLNSRYTLDCSMIAALNDWLRDVVEPAAQTRFNSRVVEIKSMGTYSCRGINGMAGATLSEHAFGNAMDIGGFVLADGREITIVRDWYHGDEASMAFLRDVDAGACTHFTTVLGPGYNMFHYNHFHVDLAMRGNTSTGPRRVCKPRPHVMPAPEHAPDGLPEPPPVDEDLDISQAGAANAQALAMRGPGGDIDGSIPPPAPIASYRRQPAPTYQSASAYPPPHRPEAPAYRSASAYPPPRPAASSQTASSYEPETARRGDPVAISTYAADHRPQKPAQSAAPGSLFHTRGGLAPDGGYHMQTTAYAERRPEAPASAYQPPTDITYHSPRSAPPERRAAVPGSMYQPPGEINNGDIDSSRTAPQRSSARAAGTSEGRPADWDLPSQ